MAPNESRSDDYNPYTDPVRWALFDAKVKVTSGCHVWVASIANTGYGAFGIGGQKTTTAHRYAWIRVNGPTPSRLHVQHTCDVDYPKGDVAYRRCVRLSHLILGPPKQNLQHMHEVGRAGPGGPRGERHRAARLTELKVLEIRRRYVEEHLTGSALGAEYGVSKEAIDSIISRNNWYWLPGERAARRHRGNLTPEIVREVRARSAAGAKNMDLAIQFGLARPTISTIVNRKTYRDA